MLYCKAYNNKLRIVYCYSWLELVFATIVAFYTIVTLAVIV